MKFFAALSVGVLALAINASAGTFFTGLIPCSSGFSNSNPVNVNLNGSLTCGAAGISGSDTLIAGVIYLNNDYSTGVSGGSSVATYYYNILSATSSTLLIASGTVGSGTYSATGGLVADATSGLSLDSNGLGAAYFDDSLTATLTQANTGFTVNYCEAADGGIINSTTCASYSGTAYTTLGTVLAGTGAAFVQYEYSTPSGPSPEPVSMVLFGSGLLVVSLIGRKRFLRK